jgi:hypothetical protein
MGHLHMFQYGHMTPQQKILECAAKPQRGYLMGFQTHYVPPFQQNGSVGGFMDTCNKIEYGSFARAVWPNEPAYFSGLDAQIIIVNSP